MRDSLELRRKYLTVVQICKILFGYCDMDASKFYHIIRPSRTRRNHDFKLRPQAFRADYFKYSFFNRYISEWNSLPSNVINKSGINSFKVSLSSYLRSKLYKQSYPLRIIFLLILFYAITNIIIIIIFLSYLVNKFMLLSL